VWSELVSRESQRLDRRPRTFAAPPDVRKSLTPMVTFGATALLTDPPLLGMVKAPKQMQRGNVSSYGYLKKWCRIPTIADELAVSVNPAFEPWATCSDVLR
jgi:hypothetical protein